MRSLLTKKTPDLMLHIPTYLNSRFVWLIAFLLFSQITVIGQSISGRVVSEDRTPIIGAYVIHLNSEHHAHSNELGDFELHDVVLGDSLQISYLGFKPQIIQINQLEEKLTIRLEEAPFELSQVVVQPNVRALSTVADIDVSVNPVNSTQEILRSVPGLIIGQHAGGGKAEQLFLRGFDIDHGTDVAISVDGMPVNMVSHAHGQGYADLHFIIPEAIQDIDFGKGSYYADKGNYNTAGYVDFRLRDRLSNSMVSTEVGRFNTFRTVGLFDLVNTEKSSAYIGTEYILTDGPFESSQHFNRLNLMGKYTTQLQNDGELSILATHFESKWDASGQIPQRAVDAGLITRFGAIDDTEGGTTGRTNVAARYSKVLSSNSFVTTNAYFSNYDFELFSNFTFFLEDPENADQIRQFEKREIFGFNTEWNQAFYTDKSEGMIQGGVGLRYDNIDGNQLSRTKNRREILEHLQFGDVDETNLFAYVNLEYELGDWTFNPGLRLDFFSFSYVDNLDTLYNRQEQRESTLSPKLNIFYNASRELQLYVKTGVGFHTNDTRVVLEQSADKILPLAYSADLGMVYRPLPRLFINAAFWYLFLEQEFVYVGDAGIVEPSGETRRLGVDFGARYQITDWLVGNLDINYSLARSVESQEGEDFIPLAPALTSTGGFNVLANNFKAGLSYRYVEDRPANEDNSIVAGGYFLADINASYQLGRLNLGVAVENLFDVDWNETQFATESRLQDEARAVEEIHFTPGTPLFVKGIVKLMF